MSSSSSREKDRDAVVMAALPHVPFDGWSEACLKRAAANAGLKDGDVVRLFPGGGGDAVVHFMAMADRLMLADLADKDLSVLKVRERIALAIRTRLERWRPHREAVRRAIGLVPLPSLAGPALRGWYDTVDAIWRAAGDKSTDFSFYTKRMLLAGVYCATLLYWIDDRSEDSAATWAFLDRRIADVMRIPKVREHLEARFKNLPKPTDVLRRFAMRGARGWTAPGSRKV